MRLIDADELPYIKAPIAPILVGDKVVWCDVVYKLHIDNAPTVDAVPVVRCKDCKHRPIKPDDYNPITMDGFVLEFPDDECPCQCDDGWYSWYPPDDFFCARGDNSLE